MPGYKLIYFDSKGRAEVSRLMFAKAGVEYEDIRVQQDDFKDMKDRTPLGQLPILEIDGRVICQSYAITRFLAKRFGFYGKNEFEEVRIDEIAMGVEDILQHLFVFFFEEDEAKKTVAKKKFEEETLPNHLNFLERLLVQNNGGDGFFVGDSLTAADLYFTNYIVFPAYVDVHINWSNFPKLQALIKRVEENDPIIAAWIRKRPATKF